MDTPVCLHCERYPPHTRLGLCRACDSRRAIRRLYLRRKHWSPAWEQHLRILTARATARLPLFPEPPESTP